MGMTQRTRLRMFAPHEICKIWATELDRKFDITTWLGCQPEIMKDLQPMINLALRHSMKHQTNFFSHGSVRIPDGV
ncbi:uncharacterized protein RAG0_10686 [Rhynchosporium agropyri]|uniref:Uncharacterized protein n=1 Tax=Rhynchosporium agropyri TaxID=914238 RepID=A0A1E1L0T0_9HELO|nr:uncharacterized protein RAG0_10686 [Rhynchosporium agropyri]